MKFPQSNVVATIASVLAVLALTGSVGAGEDGWSDVAEFSLVATAGNSESQSLGFKNTLARAWDKSSVTFRAGGIRVETTTTDRVAIGPSDSATVTETDSTVTNAENYFLNGRYDRKITDRFFWYAGAGWDRNEPAGIQNRYIADAGVGNIWFDEEGLKFKTSYGLTFTDQEDVVKVDGIDDSFAGYRFAWDYLNQIGKNATYTNVLVLDGNIDEGSDWRGDMVNGLAVAMNARLAIKLGLQFLYDNQPSITLVENVDPMQNPVRFPLDELDTVFTASLVVNFK